MSQYHAICSLDAGEALNPMLFGDDYSLTALGAGSGYGATTSAFALAIAPGGRWHGHRLAVIGDYVHEDDLPAGVPFADDPLLLYSRCCTLDDEPSAASYELQKACAARWGVSYNGFTGPLWNAVYPAIEKVSAIGPDEAHGDLFVVNLDSGECLDPHRFGCGRNLDAIALKPHAVIFATLLLLSVSNGRGGGDFATHSPLIGSWRADRVALAPRPTDVVDRSGEMVALLSSTPVHTVGLHHFTLGEVPRDLVRKAAHREESLEGVAHRLGLDHDATDVFSALLRDGQDFDRALAAARGLSRLSLSPTFRANHP
jgi:hypothetical protein